MPKSIIRVKPKTYNPTKAVLKEPIILRNPDGSRATSEQAARAIVRPVRIIEDPNA